MLIYSWPRERIRNGMSLTYDVWTITQPQPVDAHACQREKYPWDVHPRPKSVLAQEEDLP
jgi:hypothetical protein